MYTTKMDLVKYDASCQGSNGSIIPNVSFSKGGIIRINRAAAEMLELNDGSRIAILQDKNNPDDWYLAKDKEGFVMRKNGSDRHSFATNCSRVAKKLMGHFGLTETTRIQLGTETVEGEYWPLITAKLRK